MTPGEIARATRETVGGMALLVRLAVVSRFRLRGAYWTWRTQTAFGRGWPTGRFARCHAVVDYARWMWRMRSLG